MRILITGAAGYIGSHTAEYLNEAGYQVAGIDNFSMGHRQPDNVEIHRATLPSQGMGFISSFEPDAIVHLAAHSSPNESMTDPFIYLRTNPFATIDIAQIALVCNVKTFIYASTANIYGQGISPHTEDEEPDPQTPYGTGKLMSEMALSWLTQIHPNFKVICLRFFNVVGGHHPSHTHMIPNMLRAKQNGEKFKLFGTNYPTKDGTCVRDLIHINDVSRAIEMATTKLPSGTYNVCSGKGTSVLEICHALNVDYVPEPRRPGDPPVLIGNNTKLKNYGWEPKETNLVKELT